MNMKVNLSDAVIYTIQESLANTSFELRRALRGDSANSERLLKQLYKVEAALDVIDEIADEVTAANIQAAENARFY